jgi:nitrous oxidase accessory protein NosD
LSIQAAVDASAAGDRVLVCAGRYRIVQIVGPSKDGLSLEEAEPGATIAAGGRVAIRVKGVKDLRVEGFRITLGDHGCQSIGIMFSESTGWILRNRIITPARTPARCAFGVGIWADAARFGQILVEGNAVRDFTEAGIQAGRDARWNETRVVMRSNLIERFRDPRFRQNAEGIAIYSGDTVTDGNVIRFGHSRNYTTGIDLGADPEYSDPGEAQISGNHIGGANTDGIALSGFRQTVVRGNTLVGNDWGVAIYIISGGAGIEILENRVTGGRRGIDTYGGGNKIHDNDFRGNSERDCHDRTRGRFTAGTRNIWTNNLGETSIPVGICSPAS